MLKINNGICCHSHELITMSEGPTSIHHSKNSKTAIHWYFLKEDPALKFHPNVKAHFNYWLLFC